MRELLKRAYHALGMAEGLLAARAYRELYEPPFEHGKAHKEWEDCRALLADIQRELNQEDEA